MPEERLKGNTDGTKIIFATTRDNPHFSCIRGVACDVHDRIANGGFHCFISSPHPIACRPDLHNTTNDHLKLLLIKGGHLTYPHTLLCSGGGGDTLTVSSAKASDEKEVSWMPY